MFSVKLIWRYLPTRTNPMARALVLALAVIVLSASIVSATSSTVNDTSGSNNTATTPAPTMPTTFQRACPPVTPQPPLPDAVMNFVELGPFAALGCGPDPATNPPDVACPLLVDRPNVKMSSLFPSTCFDFNIFEPMYGGSIPDVVLVIFIATMSALGDFSRRRKLYPLNQRDPWMVFGTVLSSFLNSFIPLGILVYGYGFKVGILVYATVFGQLLTTQTTSFSCYQYWFNNRFHAIPAYEYRRRAKWAWYAWTTKSISFLLYIGPYMTLSLVIFGINDYLYPDNYAGNPGVMDTGTCQWYYFGPEQLADLARRNLTSQLTSIVANESNPTGYVPYSVHFSSCVVYPANEIMSRIGTGFLAFHCAPLFFWLYVLRNDKDDMYIRVELYFMILDILTVVVLIVIASWNNAMTNVFTPNGFSILDVLYYLNAIIPPIGRLVFPLALSYSSSYARGGSIKTRFLNFILFRGSQSQDHSSLNNVSHTNPTQTNTSSRDSTNSSPLPAGVEGVRDTARTTTVRFKARRLCQSCWRSCGVCWTWIVSNICSNAASLRALTGTAARVSVDLTAAVTNTNTAAGAGAGAVANHPDANADPGEFIITMTVPGHTPISAKLGMPVQTPVTRPVSSLRASSVASSPIGDGKDAVVPVGVAGTVGSTRSYDDGIHVVDMDDDHVDGGVATNTANTNTNTTAKYLVIGSPTNTPHARAQSSITGSIGSASPSSMASLPNSTTTTPMELLPASASTRFNQRVSPTFANDDVGVDIGVGIGRPLIPTITPSVQPIRDRKERRMHTHRHHSRNHDRAEQQIVQPIGIGMGASALVVVGDDRKMATSALSARGERKVDSSWHANANNLMDNARSRELAFELAGEMWVMFICLFVCVAHWTLF